VSISGAALVDLANPVAVNYYYIINLECKYDFFVWRKHHRDPRRLRRRWKSFWKLEFGSSLEFSFCGPRYGNNINFIIWRSNSTYW
jgi:hypothetical protein